MLEFIRARLYGGPLPDSIAQGMTVLPCCVSVGTSGTVVRREDSVVRRQQIRHPFKRKTSVT